MRKMGFEVGSQRVSMQSGRTRSSSQTQIPPPIMLHGAQATISVEVQVMRAAG